MAAEIEKKEYKLQVVATTEDVTITMLSPFYDPVLEGNRLTVKRTKDLTQDGTLKETIEIENRKLSDCQDPK